MFFIDATTKETIKADLEALTPQNIEPSIDAALHWLAGQQERNWLLIFNNADDRDLNLGKFFPQSRFGNILVTTRNQELLNLSTSSEKVSDLNQEDIIKLLMKLSETEETKENELLVAQIVQVFLLTIACMSHLAKLSYRTFITFLWQYLMLALTFGIVRH